MTTIRKPSAFSAVVAVGVLLLQCCACTFTGKPQKIPVTSNPAGAGIIVDGQEMGFAPLNLSLRKDQDHTVRIEKPGYNPVEIRLQSKSSQVGRLAPVAAALLAVPVGGGIGALLGFALSNELSGFGTGLWIGATVAFIGTLAFAKRSAEPVLTPGVLRVTLQRASEQSRTTVIVVNSEQLKNIRWIRISCSEGGTERFIAVN
jgi:hypothetical protein